MPVSTARLMSQTTRVDASEHDNGCGQRYDQQHVQNSGTGNIGFRQNRQTQFQADCEKQHGDAECGKRLKQTNITNMQGSTAKSCSQITEQWRIADPPRYQAGYKRD